MGWQEKISLRRLDLRWEEWELVKGRIEEDHTELKGKHVARIWGGTEIGIWSQPVPGTEKWL